MHRRRLIRLISGAALASVTTSRLSGQVPAKNRNLGGGRPSKISNKVGTAEFSGKFETPSAQVHAEYERINLQQGYKDYTTDSGFVVRGVTETGEDVELWVFLYRRIGDGQVLDADLAQTTLVYGRFSGAQRRTMSDTVFRNKGHDFADYMKPGAITTLEDARSVSWTGRGITITSSPPRWTLQVEDIGVRCNIELEQRGPAMFEGGRFEQLMENKGAGYIAQGRASGRIEVDGKTLILNKAWFVRERRFLVGRATNKLNLMSGDGLNWMSGWSDDFCWYLRMNNSLGFGNALLTIGENQYPLSRPGAANIVILDHWLDPRTNLLTPYRWRIRADFPIGRLDAVVSSFARATYPWAFPLGLVMVNQFSADTDATLTLTSGKTIRSRQVGFNEYMRTLYLQSDEGQILNS